MEKEPTVINKKMGKALNEIELEANRSILLCALCYRRASCVFDCCKLHKMQATSQQRQVEITLPACSDLFLWFSTFVCHFVHLYTM